MNTRNFIRSCDLLFVILSFILISVKGDDNSPQRKSTISLNPGCTTQNCTQNNINIIYIKASSTDDVLHYLIAGGNITNTLSLVIIRSTNLSSSVSINWDNLVLNDSSLRNESIILHGSNFTSQFGLIFTKIYEYEDDINEADMTGSNWRQWGFNDFQWNLVDQSNVNQGMFKFEARQWADSMANKDDLFMNNGSIIIEISYKNVTKFNTNMPRLQYNTNNTQFKLILNNLQTNVTKSRFAVQFALFNSINTGLMHVDVVQSIDDETSPGVFRFKNFMGQTINEAYTNQTYVQWKPVCYTKSGDTSLNSISVARDYPPQKLQDQDRQMKQATTSIIQSSIAYLVFGQSMFLPHSSMSLINVTFGIAGDKFYADKYIGWYASFGFGTPPVGSISLTIIMVLIFGLGLPFLLVVVGSIYLVIKRRMSGQNSNAYVSIDESIN